MNVAGRRIRPLFTLVFVAMGALAGEAFATWYVSRLQQLIGTEEPRLFGVIPINPTQLNPSELTVLYVVSTVMGALLGFVMERTAFHEAARVRSRFDSMAPQDKIAMGIGIMLGLVLTALLQSILKTPLWVNVIIGLLLCAMSLVAV